MQLCISEITDLKYDKVCVAGWCAEKQRMVRPLRQRGHRHWPSALVDGGTLTIGSLVECDPTAASMGRSLPHAREDTVVQGDLRRLGQLTPEIAWQHLLPSTARSVLAAFGDVLAERRWIPDGADCPSLAAVLVNPRRMGFEEDDKGPRLWFYDEEDSKSWNFRITCRRLRREGRGEGLERLAEQARGSNQAMIRIGVATALPPREPGGPPRCFLQVNGLLFK